MTGGPDWPGERSGRGRHGRHRAAPPDPQQPPDLQADPYQQAWPPSEQSGRWPGAEHGPQWPAPAERGPGWPPPASGPGWPQAPYPTEPPAPYSAPAPARYQGSPPDPYRTGAPDPYRTGTSGAYGTGAPDPYRAGAPDPYRTGRPGPHPGEPASGPYLGAHPAASHAGQVAADPYARPAPAPYRDDLAAGARPRWDAVPYQRGGYPDPADVHGTGGEPLGASAWHQAGERDEIGRALPVPPWSGGAATSGPLPTVSGPLPTVSGPLPAMSGPAPTAGAPPARLAGPESDAWSWSGNTGDSDADEAGWDVQDPEVWAQRDSDALLPMQPERPRYGRRDARPRPRPRPRPRRRGRRTAPLIALLVIAVFLSAGGIVGYHFLRQYVIPPDYSGPGHGTVVVEIKQGQTATDVAQTLFHLGVVASPRAFIKAVEQSSQQTALEPGFYRLHRQMKAVLAFQLLLNPASRIQLQITIPEGLRLTQIVQRLSGKSGISLKDYLDALRRPGALGLPSYARGKPEGYLFPSTYTVQPRMTASDVLRAMVTQFNDEAAKINLVATAHSVNLTPAEAIIVASLVQAEGGRVGDFPKIARVIYNRLDQSMELELDSTVMYALHTYGILATNQQLQTPSPYNTYLHRGLPPGPIDSPGEAAINAALHPAKGNWLYFVTVDPKTGVTEFTSDPAVFAQLRNELENNLAQGR